MGYDIVVLFLRRTVRLFVLMILTPKNTASNTTFCSHFCRYYLDVTVDKMGSWLASHKCDLTLDWDLEGR